MLDSGNLYTYLMRHPSDIYLLNKILPDDLIIDIIQDKYNNIYNRSTSAGFGFLCELIMRCDFSENVLIAIVTINGSMLQYVNRHTPSIQLAAIQQNGWAINWIRNPSEELKCAAIESRPQTLRCMEKKSSELCYKALERDPFLIDVIKRPTNKMYLMAIQRYFHLIVYAKHQTEAMQLCAARQDANAIRFIEKPNLTVIKTLYQTFKRQKTLNPRLWFKLIRRYIVLKLSRSKS